MSRSVSPYFGVSIQAITLSNDLVFNNIYYSLIYPYFNYIWCILWGNNYENPILQLIGLQNKAIRIINDVSFQDHITAQYVNLGLLKFCGVVKMYTCLFLSDHLCDKKPCNFSRFLVSEQRNYSTRTATSLQLFLRYLKTNIRKFSPTVIGKYFWNDLPLSIRNININKYRKLFSKKQFSNIILLSTNLLN